MKRKERKEEERRILAEIDAAAEEEKREGVQPQAQVMHCKRCRTPMEGGVCPTCGYRTYIPMAEEKRKKIRRVLTVVFVGIFLVLFFLIQK